MANMKSKQLATLLIAVLTIQLAISTGGFIGSSAAQGRPNVFVGVDVAYGDVADAKGVIDQVSSYTNLVVIGSTKVTWFPDKLNDTFDYAYSKGLSFISLPPSLPDYSQRTANKTEWYQYAPERWGNNLLGFYYLDEPGGRMLEQNYAILGNPQSISTPSNYAAAAAEFESAVSRNLGYQRYSTAYKAFTADFGLYWFDYKAGYDVILAELGWNYNRQLSIALCRGAATAQNKDWGVIVSPVYNNSPQVEAKEQLYNDMVLAYDNGAKYIIIFDGDGASSGIMQPQHFEALQQFWNYMQNNQPKSNFVSSERTAYVLPNAYGYGFRAPGDRIWGFWGADEISPNITTSVSTLLSQYGEKPDIIYNDYLQPSTNNGYNQLVYWDSYNPAPSPSPTPSPTPTQSVSASPSQTETQPPSNSFLTQIIAVTVTSTALASVIAFVYFKKRSN